MRLVRLLVMLLAMTVLPGLAPAADLVKDVARDFSSLAGVVVMPMQGEFLIDLDASRGVVAGDLFAVVKKGAPVVHPVTKAVIGTLDEVKGILQVSRVKSGYSYAVPVGKVDGVQAGDSIRRYENIRAAFWDYSGEGAGLFAELKGALPGLEWQDYAAAQASRPAAPALPAGGEAQLYFILQGNALEVRDPQFKPLRAYGLPVAQAQPAATAAVAAVPTPAPAVAAYPQGIVAAPAVQSTGFGIVHGALPEQQGLWYGPDISGTPVGMEVADVDGDGQNEIVVAHSSSLQIGRNRQGVYQETARVDLGYGQKILTVDAVDLNRNGTAELFLTAVSEFRLYSLVVEYNGQSFAVVQKSLPWYFRAIELGSEGKTLLAQRQGDGVQDFYGPMCRVQWVGGQLELGAPVTAPDGVNIFGSIALPGAGGETLWANLSKSGHLRLLDSGGSVQYESEGLFGGSEIYFERPDPNSRPTDKETRYVFVETRLASGPKGELLVAYNEGSRLMKRIMTFDKSRLRAMVWDGRSLSESWHTLPRDGYLVDYRLADLDNDGNKEVATLVTFTRESLKSKGKSAVVAFDLE